MKLCYIIITGIALCFLSAEALALDVAILPASGDTINIADVDCGKTYVGLKSEISVINRERGGILCWYYTNENSQRYIFTHACVRQNQTYTHPIEMQMPESGNNSLAVQLECYEFYDGKKDSCQDTFSYDYALENKHNCANSDGNGCLGHVIDELDFNLGCRPINFDFIPLNDSVNLYTGQSIMVGTKLVNNMNNSIHCDQGIGYVTALSNYTGLKINISAPSEGDGTVVRSAIVNCKGEGGNSLMKSIDILVNFRPDPCKFCLNEAAQSYSESLKLYGSLNADAKNSIKTKKTNETLRMNNLALPYLNNAASRIDSMRDLCGVDNRQAAEIQCNLSEENSKIAYNLSMNALSYFQNEDVGINSNESLDDESMNNESIDNSGQGNMTEPNNKITVFKSTQPNSNNVILKNHFILFGIIAAIIGIVFALILK